MKIFVKLLMGVVVLAVVAPFYLKDKNGAALLSLNNIKMPELGMPEIPQNMQSTVAGLTSQVSMSTETTDSVQATPKIKVHKWKDENGQWHFSSADNSQKGIKSEVILLDATKIPPPEPKPAAQEVASTDDVTNITPNILLPLTHGKQTMDQARQVKELLEQRSKLQQQMAP